MRRPLPARACAALHSGQAGKEQGRGREACAAAGPALPPAQRAPGLPDLGWSWTLVQQLKGPVVPVAEKFKAKSGFISNSYK